MASTSSTSSTAIRLTGMATGLDTDTTVKQMMSAYKTKLDKMKQDKEVVSWRQEMYRDILTDINTFKSTYYDVLKSDSYMLSKNSYSGYKVEAKSSITGQTAGVSVTANTGAVAGNYTVKVNKLAESAKISGSALNESSAPINLNNWQGKRICFSVGTSSEVINIGSGFVDDGDSTANEKLVKSINDQIASKSTLSGKISVSLEGSGVNTKIKFNTSTDTEIKVNSIDTSVIADLSSMVDKVMNPGKYTTNLSELGITSGSFSLTYKDTSGNSQTKYIDITDVANTTISELMDKVTSTTSGNVIMNYSELTGSFSMETLGKGSSATITASNDVAAAGKTSTNMLAKMNITTLTDTGVNAEALITDSSGNSKTVIKSSNIFTVDDVSYNLLKVKSNDTDVNTVTVETDVQKPFDKIKAFIDKYNEMIDKINTKISEKKQYTYLPLTDEQKGAMSEEQIKTWETKAKQGLLKSDGMLQEMLTSLRGAFYQSVEGAGITLSEIGLSTSSDTTQRGKIIIDDKVLKEALTAKGDQIATLFTRSSTTHPIFNADLDSDERKVRSSEEGILQKLQDIFQDYTRTSRDRDGYKGLLIERAGLKGDTSEYTSLLTKDLNDRQKRIDDFITKMNAREDRYYSQFAKLEAAMNKMNSQSSWLSNQLGTN